MPSKAPLTQFWQETFCALREVDRPLLLLVFLLIGCGIVAVYSATIASAETHAVNSFLYRDLISLAVGIGAALLVFRLPLRVIGENSLLASFVVVILMLLVHLPGIGAGALNGASRWLDLGVVTLQPSEFAKPILLVYVCHYFGNYGKQVQRKQIGVFLFILGLAGVAIFSQKDAGTALLFIGTLLLIMRKSGMPLKKIMYIVSPMIAFLGVFFLNENRWQRFVKFISGESEQQQQALYGFANGGWTGQGIGLSTRKWSLLPEVESDSIIAIIAEETGLLGITALYAIYVSIVFVSWRAASAASRRGAKFQSLLATAIGLLLTAQVCWNIGGNLGLLPMKGLTLPLISHGGTSLAAWLCTFALLFQITRQNFKNQCAIEEFHGASANA